jgi:hypothetical protein
MKNFLSILGFVLIGMILLDSCEKEVLVENDLKGVSEIDQIVENEVINNNTSSLIPAVFYEPIEIAEKYIEVETPKWTLTPHQGIMFLAAKKCGLTDARANKMKEWAAYPDEIDKEALIPILNTTWKHGYAYYKLINTWYWIYGTADAMCQANINGSGYLSKSAFYYYPADKNNGDKYLGYAGHYMVDMGNAWHTHGIISQTDHANYENWILNNWTTGHNFYNYLSTSEPTYYTVTDPKATVRNIAYYSAISADELVNAYVASGRPTGVNGGNAYLISKTKENLLRSYKYLKGLIRYTLDTESAW